MAGNPVRTIGAAATRGALDVASTGRVLVLTAASLRGRSVSAHWSAARETVRQIGRVGLRALLPALLLGALVGMTVVLATTDVLQVLAELTDPLALWRRIGILLVREIGPFVPAIIVAGWCGGIVTADLATMNAADELDASDARGVDRIHSAVVPRIAALFVSSLALSVCFVLAVLAACGLTAWMFSELPVAVFADSVLADVRGADLAIFAAKSAAFGLVVTAVAAMRGLSAGRGRADVAAAVSAANAHSLAGCLVVNALFALAVYP